MNHRHRSRLALRAAALTLTAGIALPAAAQFALSPVPGLVAAPPPTNLVLTIDDSGSMSSAFVPDSVGNGNVQSTAAFTSGDYNKLYYSPYITYAIPPNAAGQQASSPSAPTSFAAAYIDGFNPAAGTMALGTAYLPTLQYAPGDTTQGFAGPTAAVGNAAYYYLYNGATGCTLPTPWNPPPADTCFTQIIVSTTSGPAIPSKNIAAGWDETQNFANWYSFYRTRHLSIASSAAIAMSDAGLTSARVAWQSLNSCTDFTSGKCNNGGSSNYVDNRLRTFADTPTSTHRSDFYYWLFHVPANQSTPTRTAWNRTGEYFRSKGKDSPYGIDPNNNSAATTELACVNNFQITMTDGQWNDGGLNYCGTGACGNEDTTGVTLPDGTTYAPNASLKSSTSIYSDLNTGGLADIAFYYWSHNLRPDLTGVINTTNPGPVKPYKPDPSTNNPVTGTTDPNWWYWNPRNDPASWPHMVNFTIGVGLTGYLTLPGLTWLQDSFGSMPIGATTLNGSGYSNLLSYANVCTDTTGNMSSPPNCNWPVISTAGFGGGGGGGGGPGGNAGNVYDLWHAAVDSRGQAFSAESPQDLVDALHTIVTRIEGQATGSGTAAGSSSMLNTGTDLYIGTYDGSDWHGTLASYAIAPPASTNPGSISATPTWSTDTTSGSIPPPSNRHVFTSLVSVAAPGSATGVAPVSTAFTATNSALTGSPLWALLSTAPGGTDAASVVNYLLGDTTNEAPNGLKYRPRPVSKLGDIVDSNPIFSYDENFGYQVLETGTNPETPGAYLTYVAQTKLQSGRPAMVYVGANDGMLHAFNASTAAGGTGAMASPGIAPSMASTMGQELFAYVPHSVVPNLSVLASPNYPHHFYVDSTPYVGDAFLGGSWKTVLVGATGAGGKGVFALDVPLPQSFGAGNVLWDMDGTAVAGANTSYGNSDPDLGYTIGTPTVVRLADGNWYAAFGNGYLSTDACPVLYLVRLDNGNVSYKLNAMGTAGTACTVPNGLGAPTPLDIDGNGVTDFIYAGDLQGNLWKFDLRAKTPNAWGVAIFTGQSGPMPLFTATTPGTTPTPQSIVGAPSLGLGPNGVMVYFSTGHIFATGDVADTSVQSVYGIQDSGKPITSRKTIVAQPVTVAADGSGNRSVFGSAVNLMGVNDGWVVDLPGSGERVLQQPFLVGNIVVFVSDIPSGATCNGSCSSYMFGVNALTGAGEMDFFSANGIFYDAIKSTVGCLSGVTVIVESGTSILMYGFGPNFGTGANAPPGGSTSGTPTGNGPTPPVQPPCPPNTQCDRNPITDSTGRKSWHEMVQ